MSLPLKFLRSTDNQTHFESFLFQHFYLIYFTSKDTYI